MANRKEKKNSSALLVILLCIVFVALGYYLGSRQSLKDINKVEESNDVTETIDTPSPDIEPSEVINTDSEEVKEVSSTISYVGDYGYDYDYDGERTYDSLHLREDGTFVYGAKNYGCYSPSVGTYVVDNNKIILTETVKYGCDACYYLKDLKTYTVDIKDENTLVVESHEFIKGKISKEDEKSKSRYVTNPVDQGTPSGWEDPWFDCTRGY